MKKILFLLSAVTVLGFVSPTSAKADPSCNRRVVSYLACGRPVYATYQVYGYDRCGKPVGRWVTEHSSCGCNTCRPRPVYHSQRSACPPPPCPTPHYGGYSHGPSRRVSGLSFFFSR